MLFDQRVQRAAEALSGSTEAFRSSVARTAEEVRGYLAAHVTDTDGQAGRFGAEFGSFAAGRIDVERLSSVLAEHRTLEAPGIESIAQALETLSELASGESTRFVVNVSPGASLRDTVARALEDIGRAFGAARVVELSRSGRDSSAEHAQFLRAFPFRRWSKAERRLTPPLVVHVDGSDLHAAGVAEFLDGSQKLVLVVRGRAAPAPLVRLITPSTFVLQTSDEAGLDRLAAWAGPGIAALLPDGAAQFLHDPAAGAELSDRLTVTRMPEGHRRDALGGVSAAQQAEELEQLRALVAVSAETRSARADVASAAGQPAPPIVSDPVDKLAAWLIEQAGLGQQG